MRIWLASYPRSGNTYFRILWHHYYGLPTYSTYYDFRARGEGGDVSELMGHKNKVPGGDPLALWKTHELEQDTFLPAFYLVRDGREVCVSYAKYLGISIEDVIKGNTKYGSWSDHVMHWMHRPNRPRLIKFEELVSVEDPGDLLDSIIRHCGIYMPRKDSPPPQFTELHEKNPEFFRSGKLDSWMSEMTLDQQDMFWHHHERAMHFLGYE